MTNLTKILQKKSQNRGKFVIAGKCMGPISKFGKRIGQFSFSQRHIPAQKGIESPPLPSTTANRNIGLFSYVIPCFKTKLFFTHSTFFAEEDWKTYGGV